MKRAPRSPTSMWAACDAFIERMRDERAARRQKRLATYEAIRESLRRRPPPKGRKGGGSEPVAVEPNRPKLGEGGAAAALEYDE
jgi:hypothetical protein